MTVITASLCCWHSEVTAAQSPLYVVMGAALPCQLKGQLMTAVSLWITDLLPQAPAFLPWLL